MKILSIGSGKEKIRAGAITLDINPAVNPDICHNLNQVPYPLKTNEFDAVDCFDVIEHVDDVLVVMKEIHRILRPGGVIHITTPHFSSANSYRDPTHRYHLSYYSFDYLTREHQFNFYSDIRYRIKKRQIVFNYFFPLGSLLRRFANKYPQFYEDRLAWIFPAWYLDFELEKV